MTHRDVEMIKAMEIMKSYCRDIRGCKLCPMFDNCKSEDDHKRFPNFWCIPEV